MKTRPKFLDEIPKLKNKNNRPSGGK